MYWCELCKCWMNDTKAAKLNHERGAKHQENLARSKHHTQRCGEQCVQGSASVGQPLPAPRTAAGRTMLCCAALTLVAEASHSVHHSKHLDWPSLSCTLCSTAVPAVLSAPMVSSPHPCAAAVDAVQSCVTCHARQMQRKRRRSRQQQQLMTLKRQRGRALRQIKKQHRKQLANGPGWKTVSTTTMQNTGVQAGRQAGKLTAGLWDLNEQVLHWMLASIVGRLLDCRCS